MYPNPHPLTTHSLIAHLASYALTPRAPHIRSHAARTSHHTLSRRAHLLVGRLVHHRGVVSAAATSVVGLLRVGRRGLLAVALLLVTLLLVALLLVVACTRTISQQTLSKGAGVSVLTTAQKIPKIIRFPTFGYLFATVVLLLLATVAGILGLSAV